MEIFWNLSSIFNLIDIFPNVQNQNQNVQITNVHIFGAHTNDWLHRFTKFIFASS